MKIKGLIPALGVTLYIMLVGTFMTNVGKVIGDNSPTIFGPMAFLLLFSVSALTCALIVFYQPYKLFFDNKKKAAINQVVSTVVWLFVFFVLALTLAILIK